MTKKQIIISTAVPLNNGDAALVFSLSDTFERYGFKPIISTYYYHTVSHKYPKRTFVREITDHKLFRKLPPIKKATTKLLINTKKAYQDSIAIVASPGGYINDYYGFDHTLELLRQAKLFQKKTGIYAQSIGPLNKNSIQKLLYYSKFIDHIFVRDQKSYSLLSEIGIDNFRYSLVEDGAFLIEPTDNVFRKKPKIAAFSVRSWHHDERKMSTYVEMVHAFVNKMVNMGIQVEFISTCQGLSNYTNDAETAKYIYDILPDHLKQKCSVNSRYYTLEEYLKQLERFDLTVGTRLHSCLLSLLRNKPAFNISYEFKGLECYTYLGVPELSCDYNANTDEALNQLSHFLENFEWYAKQLQKKTHEMHKRANQHFERFIKALQI